MVQRTKYSPFKTNSPLILNLLHILYASFFVDLFIRCALNKFPDYFGQGFKIVVDTWKLSMLLLYILWDDWPTFYDFSFKSTAKAASGIHPTKTWLSQLVNFKNAIWTWWHFRRTICYDRRWMIGRSGETRSGISMLAARHDDDDVSM